MFVCLSCGSKLITQAKRADFLKMIEPKMCGENIMDKNSNRGILAMSINVLDLEPFIIINRLGFEIALIPGIHDFSPQTMVCHHDTPGSTRLHHSHRQVLQMSF